VIGLSFDGTGYGDDEAIWGCEFLVSDLKDFERAGHLAYVPLPGGDAAIRHPYRVALSHLAAAGVDLNSAIACELFPRVPKDELELVMQQIEKRVNCVDTSSAGRLFDAVSALLGVCSSITYEAQAAIELESVADASAERTYPYGLQNGDRLRDDEGIVIDSGPIIRGVLDDIRAGVDASEVAGAFHNTVVAFAGEVAGRLAEVRGLGTVVLSGGVFQNRLFSRKLTERLERVGLRVLLPREVPTNDGGVSLGQAVVARERHRAGAV
jgi:hydrogenase maturation protein HypF